MVQIAPSILAADFSRLGEEVMAVVKAGADIIHVDIMDGHFVPEITFGPVVLKEVRKMVSVPFDVHLMVEEPGFLIESFNQIADSITIHLEAVEQVEEQLKHIRKLGKKVGLSIKPETPINALEKYLDLIDLVLVMSVEPGAGGQAFMREAFDRIVMLKKMIGKRNIQISVDGGINAYTAADCIKVGTDILVAGSYIFKSADYRVAIQALRG